MASIGLESYFEREQATGLMAAMDQYDLDRSTGSFESWGIPASRAGGDCTRQAWYALRWLLHGAPLPPHVIRIMETGLIYEDRARQRLCAACTDAWPVNPKTSKQWPIRQLGGWLRGRGDMIARGVPEMPPHEVFGVEIKSLNQKKFSRVIAHSLIVAMPDHYCQLQMLLHEYGLARGLYVAINRNTEELHVEIVGRDDSYINTRMLSLRQAVDSSTAPLRVSEKPDHFQCRFCDFAGLCKGGDLPQRRTCRSCIHSTFLHGCEVPTLKCDRHGLELTPEEQKQGCDDHLFLPDLIPGAQIDANEADMTITYQMPDGSMWIDRGQPIDGENDPCQ
jgi:hypothetical protein